jgi:nucleoside-diphosphate-sugar epimerase
MRVFVTGATGFIGSAVVRELLDAGHQVVGLARSDASAAALTAAGAEPHRGTLDDLDSLRRGAAAADGVIHAAMDRTTADYVDAARTDLRVIETLGEALAGSGRPFVATSGTIALSLNPGRLGTEDDDGDPSSPVAVRLPSEAAALSFAARGVRASAVRLPPSVHGRGDHGFVPALIAIARAKGVSAYPGDGVNQWPAVHRLDAARVFRLALESASPGERLHAVDDEGIPVRQIAEVIGRHLSLPVASLAREEIAGHFGFLGQLLALDVPASSEVTRKRLGWSPGQPGLLADLDEGHYFTV